MSNYSVLKQDINNNIYENQTQQITGTVLNAILNEMTASLGAGYQFAGVATLGMNPGDPDQRVFYLAGEGIYTNFGGIQVPAGKLGVLKWDNRWTLQTIDGLGGGGANLTGYVSLASTDDLPDEGQPTLGYLCGTNLYLYVGEGGDTKEGKYQNCGSFRGPQGLQGDPGVGIASVTQTTTSTEDEGINVITVTKEDGTQSTFQVRNGSKGSQGIQGPQGVQGEPGRLQARYKQVETLPTASADTVDYIYLVASQTPNVYDMYYTEENQGAYSWKSLGTTAVQLSDYATKAEVSQLEHVVTETTEQSRNIFILTGFEGKSGLTVTGNEVYGTAQSFHNAFGGYNYVTPYAKAFKANTQYTLSFKAKNEGGDSTTGQGLQARFVYSDNTLGVAFAIGNDRTSWIEAGAATSASGKTLVGVGFSYGSAGGNIWHIKDLQLEEGTSKTNYTPPYSAVDFFARGEISPLLDLLPYTQRDGYTSGVSSFTNVYVIKNTILLKGHTYKATIVADSSFTAPSDFNLKIVNSSSDSTVLRIMTLGGLTISEKTETFKWENASVNDYRVGFYGNGNVNTPLTVYLIDATLDALIAGQGTIEWDVINRNKHKEAALVSVAAHQGNQAIKVADKFTLLHFSDVHGNTANLADIVAYMTHYADLLDDAIHTGDSVETKYADSNPFESVDGAETILNVIGNHEAWLNTSDPDYYATEKQTYDKIFAPSIANWGVVQPTGAAENGYCYYYKDFTTAGFRLVVLDSVHWHYRNGTTDSNPAQKSWFESVLADAITQNLRVVCATHYTPQNGIVPVENTGFNVLGTTAGANIADGWYAADEIFGCVDTFIGNGGKFMGWIAGHTHEDFFGTVRNHTGQPIVIIGTSKGSGSANNKFIVDTVAQDNFNVITFENLNSKDYIKVVKMGQDTDIYTRSKKTICYNFTDGVLISTT